MASFQFNHTPKRVMNQTINLNAGGLYAFLLTAVPLQTAIALSELTQLTGGNYAPLYVPGTTIEDYGTGGGKLMVPNPTWTLLTSNPVAIVGCAFAPGSSPTDYPISYLEFTEPRYATGQLTGSDFVVGIPASGIAYFQVAAG